MKKIISLALSLVFVLLCFSGCANKSDDKVIRVGASPTPHALILNYIKDDLAAKGYTLEVVEYSDYVLPNSEVESGALDANFFQHQPYLTDFNSKNNTHIVSVAAIHYEPYGIYASKTASLDALQDGAKIMVTNDSSNEARALLLLQQVGLIKLKDGAGVLATKADIVENPHNYEIVEVEAASITRLMADADLAIINGNYALLEGLKISDALATEDLKSIGATTYANILCVKEGHEDDAKIKALVECLLTDKVRTYINETFNGACVPVF